MCWSVILREYRDSPSDTLRKPPFFRESDEIGAGIKRSLADGLRKEGEKRDAKKMKKGGMLDAVLGDVPSDDSDDDASESDDE